MSPSNLKMKPSNLRRLRLSKTNRSYLFLEINALDDENIVSAVRMALLKEDSKVSILGLTEILRRAEKQNTVLANELMVGGLIVSTCRDPRFSNRVIDGLPQENRATLRARLVTEFIHKFSLEEVERALVDCIALLQSVPQVAQSAIARVVLGGRDDLFFYLVENLHDLDFDFTIGDLRWMSDQSEYTHGPRENPGYLQYIDANFHTLVLNRGTTRMKEWALSHKTWSKVTV